VDAMPHINNKGITTLDRRPKDAYYFYKAQLTDNPFIKVAPALWDKRAGMQEAPGKKFCNQKIWVYSNSENVEVKMNGESVGTKKVKNSKAEFTVPFKNGCNQIEAIATKNGQTIKDVMDVEFILHPLNLKDDEVPFKTIRINAGAHFYFTDNYGQLWVPDKAYEKGNWGYIGGKKYTTWKGHRVGTEKNIFGTKNDPIFQTQRDSLTSYKFDVPKGKYEITLHFAELLSEKQRKKLIYNLNAGDSEQKSDKPTDRLFTVKMNNEPVLTDFNIAKEYSGQRAVSKTFYVEVTDQQGITVSFEGISGNPVINGIKVRKMY
jgi:beta-galactosidase